MLARNIFRVLQNVEPFGRAWAEETRKALKSHLPLWVVMGDSMSQGIGASEHRKGWVGQALDILHHQGKDYAIINLSKSGAKIEDVLYSQLTAFKALHIRPAIITVLVGSNDLLSLKYRLKLRANLQKLLNELPKGTIVGNIFNRPNTRLPFRPIFMHKPASDLLLKIAEQRELMVVSLDEVFKTPWSGKLAPDRFHPNDRGYVGIAHAFVDAMQKADDNTKEFSPN